MLAPVVLYLGIVDPRFGGADIPLLARQLLVIVRGLSRRLDLPMLTKVLKPSLVIMIATGDAQEVHTTTVVSIDGVINHGLRQVIRLHPVDRIDHLSSMLRVIGRLPIGLVAMMLIEKYPNRPPVMSPGSGFSIQMVQKVALDKTNFSTNLNKSDFPFPPVGLSQLVQLLKF